MLTAMLLFCLPLMAYGAEPEVRVQSRLVPEDSAVVGGTFNLEVDLLVDTWFTAAPVMPTLDLPGAVVSPPSGEAEHITEQQDGKTFFGLRFAYQVTPLVAQRFEIPAMEFQVHPGQADSPVTVRSQPLSIIAKGLTGAADEAQHLVARNVTFTQEIERSHDPLREGDSVTRRLQMTAEGAQAMLMPSPQFAEINGLKRYVQTPKVTPLSDGRGGTTGGTREDSAIYVIAESGQLTLPAIELQWWDIDTGEARSVSVPEVELEAIEGTYQAPFSINEDLRALGQTARVRISKHWLLLASLLVLGGVLAFVGRAWPRILLMRFRHWQRARHEAWLNSPEYAWKLARQQANASPLQLGGLYLWVRRTRGSLTVSSLLPLFHETFTDRLLAFFHSRYSKRLSSDKGSVDLAQVLPEMRQVVTEQHKVSRARRHGLRSLNLTESSQLNRHSTR